MEINTLGANDSNVQIPEDQFVAPYFQINTDGTQVYDASFKQYSTDKPLNEIKAREATNVAITARSLNQDLIAKLEL